jgi:hypothetical protein
VGHSKGQLLATDRNGQRKRGGGPCVASIAFVWTYVFGNFLFLSSKLVLKSSR